MKNSEIDAWSKDINKRLREFNNKVKACEKAGDPPEEKAKLLAEAEALREDVRVMGRKVGIDHSEPKS